MAPPRRNLLTRSALCICFCFAFQNLTADDWETLVGCEFVDYAANDGDSFRVEHEDRILTFRLCYVDTPEPRDFEGMEERWKDQAEYWQIPLESLFEIASESRDFTKELLSKTPFTVHTFWHDAKGRGENGRFFAVVEVEGGDLAELLVEKGFARIYGFMPDHPMGKTGPEFMDRLREIERAAFEGKVGGWKNSERTSPPRRAPVSSKKNGMPSLPGNTKKRESTSLPAY